MSDIDISRLNLLERDVEDWLFENPRSLRNSGIDLQYWIARQFEVPSGIIDLLGVAYNHYHESPTLRPVVVEVKLGDLTGAAIAQVCRYANDIQGIIDELAVSYGPLEGAEPYKLLVGGGPVRESALYEAEAAGVVMVCYTAELQLEITGRLRWSNERKNELSTRYRRLADSEPFSVFRSRATFNLTGEFTDLYPASESDEQDNKNGELEPVKRLGEIL
jgi:hypothetical protein